MEINPGDFIFANVRVLSVYDGDTIHLDIDMGFHQHRVSLDRAGKPDLGYRLLRIDAPELRSLATRVAGKASRDYLASLVMGKPLIVQTVDVDSFGRFLVEIWVDGENINDKMLSSGHAVPYRAS